MSEKIPRYKSQEYGYDSWVCAVPDVEKLETELAECKTENERLRERLKKFTEVDVCALHGFRDNEEGTCPQCSANFWKSEYEQYLNYLELVANVLLEQIPDSNALEKIYGIIKKAELI